MGGEDPGDSKSKALEAERRGGRRKVAARFVGAQVLEGRKCYPSAKLSRGSDNTRVSRMNGHTKLGCTGDPVLSDFSPIKKTGFAPHWPD